MSAPLDVSQPRAATRSRRWLHGVLGVLAMCVVVSGLSPSSAQAQKIINFDTFGSVNATLVFTNQIVPDVYSFFATIGEQIRVQTSNNSFDTTIRVIGPDASISLFDDDSGGNRASRLVFTAADTGAYIVVVSSFSGNPGGGNYTLTLARGSFAAQAATASLVSGDQWEGAYMSEIENPVEVKP